MDREWINGGAKCAQGRELAYIRVYTVWPWRIPRSGSHGSVCSNGHTTAAVHISPKQLHCFSHNEGPRVRSDRGGGRVFTEYRGFFPAARRRDTIPQSHSLLRTISVVKNIDDGVLARGHRGIVELIAIITRLARNEWINPELGKTKKE